LCMKDNSNLGHLLDFSFVTKFQSRGSQHDHGLYGLQMNQFMVWIQTMQLKILWTNIYHVIIIN
jgi:hypothetical protein